MEQDPFLRETRFCDYSHPSVRGVVADFRSRHRDQRELAVALFYFVRDQIKYEVGNWHQTAAQTLIRRRGTCTNSANLLVALLRCAGNPAGYGVMNVRGREYFGPIAPPRLVRLAAEVSKHFYSFVQVDGVWLRCDASDDLELSLATRHLNPQSEVVDWDGSADATLNLHADHILDDRGPLPDIDAMLSKPMRAAIRIPVNIANCCLDFMRREGMTLTSPEELERRFEQWLRAAHPAYWWFYRSLPSGKHVVAAGKAGV